MCLHGIHGFQWLASVSAPRTNSRALSHAMPLLLPGLSSLPRYLLKRPLRPTHDVQANLLNDYLLPHEKGEKKRVAKRKIKPLQKQDGDHVQV